MDPTEIVELRQLLKDGTNPVRAAHLARHYADWQDNLAKQSAQALIPQIEACTTVAEVLTLAGSEAVGKSAKYKDHVRQLAANRIAAIGVIA